MNSNSEVACCYQCSCRILHHDSVFIDAPYFKVCCSGFHEMHAKAFLWFRNLTFAFCVIMFPACFQTGAG